MKRAVTNRWIYAHVGTIRWIKQKGVYAWVFYPPVYLIVRFFLWTLDFSTKVQQRIEKRKGGDIEQNTRR